MRRLLPLICPFICLIAAVARAEASDPATAARGFYEAFARGDERAVAQAWAPSAPDALRRRTVWTMRSRCMRLLVCNVTGVKTDGQTARVTIDALLGRRTRAGEEAPEPHSGAILAFTLDGGQWRVAQWTLREETLADAIASAPDDRARAALVDAAPRIFVPLLNRLLARHGLAAVNARDWTRASSITTLMKRLAREDGDLAGESLALSIDCLVLLRSEPRESIAKAIDAGRESLALAERSGDPDALARALLRLEAAESDGRPASAHAERYERVLALADDLEDPLPIGTAASRLAAMYADRGDHRRAVGYAGIARELAERNGDLLSIASAELNLAGEYQFNGDLELAREHFAKALSHELAGGYRKDELLILATIASLDQRLGHDAAARRMRAEVLQRADPKIETEALSEIRDGDITAALERGALADAERAARTAIREAKQPEFLDRAWFALGNIHLRQHRPNDALEDMARAKELALGDSSKLAVITAGALRQLGKLAEAAETLREAIDAVETARASIVADDRQRGMLMRDNLALYVGLVDVLVAQGEAREAFAVADQTKGRALLDLLAGAEARVPAMSDEERRTESELTARVSGVRAHDASSRAELARNRSMLDAYRLELRAKHPRSVVAAQARLTPAQWNALLPRRDAAFVEYVLTGSRLCIFVVRRSDAGVDVRVRSVAIASKVLERTVQHYRDALAAGDLGYGARARWLYTQLLAPIEDDLRGVKTLGIVPDGVLWHVPFETLMDARGAFVAERMATFYVPSIAVYAAMRDAHNTRQEHAPSLLAFADPLFTQGHTATRAAVRSEELTPLPDARREVSAVAGCCTPHSVYIGREALESRLKAEGGKYDVIHFATHGVLDDTNPMYSHLLLAADGAEDGLLETWEMMRLDLHAELVVLSACDTARGKVGAGEGLIGMSWALFAAGTPSTIAAQWPVDSATSADLMIAFYRDWRGQDGVASHVAKARALQRARAAIRRDPRRRHPFFWASHVLIGLDD